MLTRTRKDGEAKRDRVGKRKRRSGEDEKVSNQREGKRTNKKQRKREKGEHIEEVMKSP